MEIPQKKEALHLAKECIHLITWLTGTFCHQDGSCVTFIHSLRHSEEALLDGAEAKLAERDGSDLMSEEAHG